MYTLFSYFYEIILSFRICGSNQYNLMQVINQKLRTENMPNRTKQFTYIFSQHYNKLMFKTLKKQYRYIPFFIPLLIYFICLIFYPILSQKFISHESLKCDSKNLIVKLDQTLFKNFIYQWLDNSSNSYLLLFFAIPYILHFANPILFLLYIYVKKKGAKAFWSYIFGFGLICCICIIIQYILPTSPPWIYLSLSPEAKFYKVDQLTGIPLFHRLYGLNKLICGAFPSLHVGWVVAISLNQCANIYFGLFYIVYISCAAIYSGHHWIIDVVFGLIISFVLVQWAKKIVERLQVDKQYQKDTPIIQGTIIELNATNPAQESIIAP